MLTGRIDNHSEFIKCYGNIVRIKSNFFLVQDPQLQKYYMAYKIKKDSIHMLLDVNGSSLFSSVGKDSHSLRKKLIAPAFNIESLSKWNTYLSRWKRQLN
ncbi:hypothetical protein CONCODRAFT_2291 [Conidiobolus coronatus NRRL 28638]|uniref:Cytochrome P450 n=1 Tax=Conidiobolus coronatus (strain ATCC 28846 / CBS 209.66 / NRRL 28638) TaxID=796925 RepID=A0A137PIA3_CONC2|nr:hypothetical protein CONCODRAFT_2291 [Conidiobolus coronatus NRRL 28638]|eukprot:KXN74727.1 hypothetical protein CONCODRAFT_2291 [Conidiobolus coronatus NRRL 28638]